MKVPMDVSRRDFVERAMLAATAALAASNVSDPLEAAEQPSDSRISPNEKVRVATIGVNGQGGSHLSEWLKLPDVEVVAICDCDPNAYKKVVGKFKEASIQPKFYQDVRKLLEDKSIDAVSIATPNHWHALMSVWAMQAGKDVYIEKPCSHNVREGRVMTQWARKLGRICQMGVQSRSMNGMRSALEFVRSGKIGKVSVAKAICFRRRGSIGLVDTPAPIPEGLDFDLWCGPAPKVVPIRKKLHYDWHWVRTTGNGDLGNQNPHELDKARWGLGKQELPKRVLSIGGRLGYVDNGDVANSQVTFYQWDDALLISDVRGLDIKSRVTFGLKGVKPFDGASNIWYGTDGYVVAPNYSSGIAYDNDGNEIERWSGGEYKAHFANFVKAIRSRNHKDLHLDIEDGHLSSALAHLGNVSWQLGQATSINDRPSRWSDNKYIAETLDSFEAYAKENNVDFNATRLSLGMELSIDPKTELSTSEAANKLFTREYRQGYVLPEIG